MISHENGAIIENKSSSQWISVVADKHPEPRMGTRATFMLNIEKASAPREIRASRTFTLSVDGQESDASLASELNAVLKLLTAETNIKTGLQYDEETEKFKFTFAPNGRAKMYYTLSSNLAERLRTTSTAIRPETAFLAVERLPPPAAEAEPEAAAAEQLAANILEAQNLGLVYVCSPAGTTEYFPSKIIAVLAPDCQGSYRMVDSPFLTSPFVCDGALLRSLPAGRLGLHFYTQETGGKFERFVPGQNMRFQGNIVWRRNTV
jgi:hypothetical protein